MEPICFHKVTVSFKVEFFSVIKVFIVKCAMVAKRGLRYNIQKRSSVKPMICVSGHDLRNPARLCYRSIRTVVSPCQGILSIGIKYVYFSDQPKNVWRRLTNCSCFRESSTVHHSGKVSHWSQWFVIADEDPLSEKITSQYAYVEMVWDQFLLTLEL
jgi:hypothetical protein